MSRRWIGRAFPAALLVSLIAAAFIPTNATAGDDPTLTATVRSASGAVLGNVRFTENENGSLTVRAKLSGLTPGFHGMHVHGTGTCDASATDPVTGAPSPFLTAGGHHNPTSAIHGAHAGDMPPLLVTSAGIADLRFVTDRITFASLLDANGSAVIVHAGPDNLAHIPATTATGGERYHSHVDLVFGPDTATRATGDAGSRFGCGTVQTS